MSFLRSFTAPAATGRILRAPETVREPESSLPPIVLIYEDMTAALRAVGQLYQLRRHLPRGFEQRLATWNFSMLGQADLHERTRADGRQANLIVLASAGIGSELPAPVAAWLRDALRDRDENQPCLLAPLFHHHREAAAPDSRRLRQIQRLAATAGTRLLLPEVPVNLRAVA